MKLSQVTLYLPSSNKTGNLRSVTTIEQLVSCSLCLEGFEKIHPEKVSFVFSQLNFSTKAPHSKERTR